MNENNDKNTVEEQKKDLPSSFSSMKNSSAVKGKLIKLMMIIGAIFLVVIVFMLIMGSFNSRNLKYDDIETKMREAAIKYYKKNENMLPAEGQSVEVDAVTLANDKYMKPLSKLKKKVSCTGRVVVKKVNGNFIYAPYLDCGENYRTKKLSDVVLSEIVSSGSGLYEMNDQYVFRGEKINNYIQLDKQLFRIVKVTRENEMLIIPVIQKNRISYSWDNRYNAERSYNYGVNDYRISRVYDQLQALYNAKDNVWLSDKDKEKLSSFSLCIGKRDEKDTNNSNQLECSDILENQMIGLLSVSDYKNASIDSNCYNPTNKACQNYNYLKTDFNWWTVSASSKNSYQVIYINGNGYAEVTNASSTKVLRPVFMLGSHVMVKDGDGSEANPYTLK